MKLLTGNYSAEYGARNGGQLNVTIKNGTAQFHGSAYYYYRHEEFNANEFFNNELNVQKPRYRYENPGGTVGGPMLIPDIPLQPEPQPAVLFLLVGPAVEYAEHGAQQVHHADGAGAAGEFLAEREPQRFRHSDPRSAQRTDLLLDQRGGLLSRAISFRPAASAPSDRPC